jgi:hypothetical protein
MVERDACDGTAQKCHSVLYPVLYQESGSITVLSDNAV